MPLGRTKRFSQVGSVENAQQLQTVVYQQRTPWGRAGEMESGTRSLERWIKAFNIYPLDNRETLDILGSTDDIIKHQFMKARLPSAYTVESKNP